MFCSNTCTSTTINITNSTGPICPCASFTLIYNSVGVFATGNIYNVEMSDAFGNFTSPTIIGTLASTANSSSILCTVPCSVISSGNYLIQVTSTSPSVASNSVMLPIIQNPIIAVNIWPNDTVCPGATMILHAPNALFPPTWSGPYPVIDSVPFNNPAPPNSTTTYTIVATNVCGMTSSATVSYYTLSNSININTLPNDTICLGASVTLTVPNATSVVWSNGVLNGVPFAPTTTATYIVNATSSFGCSITDSVTVAVQPYLSNVIVASPPPYCVGSSVTLNVPAATNIVWSGGVNNGIPFTLVASNTYTVTGVSSNGCSILDSINVIANTTPIVTATTSQTDFCIGSPIIFIGGGANTYARSGGVTNGTLSYPTTSGTHTVTGSTALGCTATSVISLNMLPLPTVTATATSNGVVCSGSPTILSGGGANSYSWNGGISNGVAFNPTTSSTYTVTGTGANGCTNTTAIAITVNPLPQIGVIVSPFDVICQGQSVTISGTGGSNYTISGGVTNGVAFTPNATTTYTITGTGTNGCTNSYVTTITVLPTNNLACNITSNPSPLLIGVQSIITANIPANITAYTLQWYRANVLVATNNFPNNTYTYTPTNINDNIYAVVTGSQCSNPTSVTSNKINVTFAEGIADMQAPNNFQIYPNPAQSNININGLQKHDAIIITDAIGKIVYTHTVTNSDVLNISLNNFANGIYTASFSRKNQTWYSKIVKNRD